MKHYIKMFDGDIVYLSLESFEKLSKVLDDSTHYSKFINIRGKRIAIASIKELSKLEDQSVNLSSRIDPEQKMLEFENAAKLLEDGKPTNSREQIINEIRSNLVYLDGSTESKKEQYISSLKLAKTLYGNTSNWTLLEWSQFNETYPNPKEYLSEIAN